MRYLESWEKIVSWAGGPPRTWIFLEGTREELARVVEWCLERYGEFDRNGVDTGGLTQVRNNVRGEVYVQSFVFANTDDAMVFKLTW